MRSKMEKMCRGLMELDDTELAHLAGAALLISAMRTEQKNGIRSYTPANPMMFAVDLPPLGGVGPLGMVALYHGHTFAEMEPLVRHSGIQAATITAALERGSAQDIDLTEMQFDGEAEIDPPQGAKPG